MKTESDEAARGEPTEVQTLGVTSTGLRRRVLVVDDHEALADNLRDLLSDDADTDVTVTGRGEDALAIAREQGFDVAIVDVKLPDGSGVDWLPRLRAASPEGEVILITGYASIDAAIAALRGGAFALLLKSFRSEELRSTVHQAFAKVALRRERDLLEKRYRALIEVADVIVVGLDEFGHAVLVNPKFTAITGAEAAEAATSSFLDRWISTELRRRFDEAVRSVAHSRVPVELEAPFIARDGLERNVRWHLSAEEGAVQRGTRGLVFGIGVDVTERLALERRAADAEALSTLGTLALGLAHEVRNPLNAAVLQLHMLGRLIERERLAPFVESDVRDSMRDRVQIVVTEIKRLGRLLGEFLDLARPRGLQREAVALHEVVEGVIALHHEEALANGVTLSSSTFSRTAQVLGDREKLKQVLVNLLVNALDATPRGGSVHISISQPTDRRVLLEMRDSGSGISSQELAQVFDPFFTTKPAGTGLGLSIVRKIIEQHRASFSLVSSPDKGTTARVEFDLL